MKTYEEQAGELAEMVQELLPGSPSNNTMTADGVLLVAAVMLLRDEVTELTAAVRELKGE